MAEEELSLVGTILVSNEPTDCCGSARSEERRTDSFIAERISARL